MTTTAVSRSHCPVPVLLLALAAAPLAANAQIVGRTPGSFAVSATGAATYTIPIFAPHGPSGLQPNIALLYDSQWGNGILGVGWNLAGLSAITRCNLTYAQDGTPAAIALSTSDGYCLDGQRLRFTGGSTYGADGSQYQTEIANFALVTAHGATGNGPASFTVQGRDGRTYEYGNDANGANSEVIASGTALEWLLDKVTDRAGNTMTISYSTENGVSAAVPIVIAWTPTGAGASSYAYTMTFAYGVNQSNAGGATPISARQCRPGPLNLHGASPLACMINGYIAGAPVKEGSLLNSITINSGSSQVKQYILTYTQSATTGRDTLTQVQECATSTNDCLKPTTISYQGGSAGVLTSPTTAVGTPISPCVPTVPPAAGASVTRYDFNGDGYPDLLYEAGGTCYVAFGSASGYGTPQSTGVSGNELNFKILAGDLLGTGKDGILANNNGTWTYYAWNGSSFAPTPVTGITYDSSAIGFALVDVNGDGLPDLVTLYGPSTISLTTRLNTSSGGTPSFSNSPVTTAPGGGALSTWLITPDTQYGNVTSFDFNGDGRQDLALEVVSCQTYYMGYCVQTVAAIDELIAQTDGTFAVTQVTQPPPPNTGFSPAAFVNLNDDGCTDLVGYTAGIYIAGCNGGTAVTLSPPQYQVVAVMDWNGDGLPDLIENGGTYLYVQLSTPTGYAPATQTSVPYDSSCTYVAFDANGDGLDDLGCINGQSGTVGFSYYLHNGAGQPPDLMASVTDGYGNSVTPVYVSMMQAVNSTYFPWTDAQFPYENYLGPLYVVANAKYSDPSSSGHTYLITDYYAGAWMNLQGRGFAGFGNVESYDARNGVYDTRGYGRAFPYTGMLIADVATQNNTPSTTIFNTSTSQMTSTLAGADCLSTTPDASRRCFPYIASSTRKDYEVGGPKDAQLIRTTQTDYTFDNWGNATQVSTTVTDDDSYSGEQWNTTVMATITPDTSSNWCLDLPSEIQVTKSAPGVPAITRTITYPNPNYLACWETAQTIEPASQAYGVTQAFTRDSFGNLSDIRTTGVGMSTREVSVNWGTTGQFPTSVTRGVGTSVAQTSLMNFDPVWGLQTSSTDPNGIMTSWQYDEFGRKVKEVRPDGTYTSWGYYDCVSYTCYFGNNSLVIGYAVHNTDGTTEAHGETYYDQVERPFRWIDYHFATGGYSQNEVHYDTLGRVVGQAMPCTLVGSSSCPYWRTTTYDTLNRPVQISRPISASNNSTQSSTITYEGDTVLTTDPQSEQTSRVTNGAGLLALTQDAKGYSVSFGYDAFGSMVSAVDSLSNTLYSATYDYGLAPYQRTLTDMDLGSRSFTYDALGELVEYSDGKDQNFSMTYDPLGRQISRTEPDLTTTWTWGNSAASYNIGQLASVSANSYSESYSYDHDGRVTDRTITVPSGGAFSYDYAYNPTTGLLDTLTYPQSTSGYRLALKYAYQDGALASITDAASGTVYWTVNAINPRGQVTQDTLGNGVVTKRSYDAVTSWLSSIQSGVGGGAALQNASYLYDELGNVTQRQNSNVGLTENFYYDADYRLDHSTLNGTANLQMAYDAMGDILSRSDIAGGATWTYDANRKHAVTEAGAPNYVYTYDANGNMTSRDGSAITWTSYNQPSVINGTGQSVSFDYGPDHQRWRAVYNGPNGTETTYLVGGLLEQVVDVGDTDFRHYIYAGAEKVAIVSRTASGLNTVRYLREDHLGGVDGIENSDGTSYVKESFTAFGDRRSSCTWSGSPTQGQLSLMAAATRRGFTWHTALGTMGLNDMNGRVEDAQTGRCLSADPYMANATNTQSWNRYSYVGNNPLTYIDPSGFCQGSTDVETSTVTVCSPPPGGGGAGGGGGGSGNPGGRWVKPCPTCAPEWVPTGGLPANYQGPQGGKPKGPNDSGSNCGSGNNGDDTGCKPQTIPCAAANSSGKGVLIQIAYTDANSSSLDITSDTGFNHTFVLAEDPSTGAIYASRGGPGSGPGGGPGVPSSSIAGYSASYGPNFPDYGAVTAVQTVGYVNVPFNQVAGYMQAFAATTNANAAAAGPPTYLGPLQNSNSYTAALLMGLGFQPPAPAMSAPGYGSNSPSPQMECTRP